VTGVGWSLVVGTVVSLLPSATSFIGAGAAFAALGLGYGLLARVLARSGLLPFPEEG
jgi:hypothetical protein